MADGKKRIELEFDITSKGKDDILEYFNELEKNSEAIQNNLTNLGDDAQLKYFRNILSFVKTFTASMNKAEKLMKRNKFLFPGGNKKSELGSLGEFSGTELREYVKNFETAFTELNNSVKLFENFSNKMSKSTDYVKDKLVKDFFPVVDKLYDLELFDISTKFNLESAKNIKSISGEAMRRGDLDSIQELHDSLEKTKSLLTSLNKITPAGDTLSSVFAKSIGQDVELKAAKEKLKKEEELSRETARKEKEERINEEKRLQEKIREAERLAKEQEKARKAAEREAEKKRQEEIREAIRLEKEQERIRKATEKESEKKRQEDSYIKEIDSVTRYINKLESVSKLIRNITSRDVIYTEDLSAAFDALEKEINESAEALERLDNEDLRKKLRKSISEAKYSLESGKESQAGRVVVPGSSLDAKNINKYKTASKQYSNTIGSALTGVYKTSWNVFKKTGKTSINFIKGLFVGLGKVAGGIWNTFGSRGRSTTSMLADQLRSLAGLFSIYSIVNTGKEAVTLTSDMIEVKNIIHGVFRDASDDIESFAKSAITNFGLTQLQASKMIGVFGGMLEASNIVGDAQSVMSKNLTALSGDLASFYNMPVDDVFTKLKSGLAGETEPLRAFGLNMTVANLEAYALSKGIDESWQSMNQATQQTLRYNYILENLALAQGDFSRTSNTWANQIRLLSSNWQQLLSILGGATIKVLYPAVQVLNQMVSLAIQASRSLADIFGFDYESLENQFGVGANMSDVLSTPASLEVDTSDIDNYSDAMTDAADSTKDFSKETESAGDNLQSFDKLNNITTQDMSSYSDELGDTSDKTGKLDNLGDIGGKSLLEPISYIENVKSPAEYTNKWLDEWIDLFENKQWYEAGQKLAKLMDKGLKEVYAVLSDEETLDKAEDLGEGLAEFFNGIIDETDLFLDAGKTLGAGINLFTKFFNSFFDTLNWSQLGRDFTILIKGLVSEVDGYELGRALTQVFAAGIDFLGGAIEDEETWLALGGTLGDVLNGAIDNIDLAKTIPTLVGLAGRLFQALGSAFETVDWVGVSEDITAGINTAIDNVDPEEFGTTLGNMVMDILTLFEGVLDADWGEAGTKFGSAINSFVDTGATKKFASTAVKFLGKVIELLSSAVKEVEWKDLANSILEGLTEGFNELDPESQNIMKTLLTFLGITGGVGAIGIVVTKLGGLAGSINEIASALKLLFGVSSGAGSLSGATGVLGGLLGLVSKHPLASAVTAITAAGSVAYYKGVVEPHTEEMEKAQENLDNLAESYKGVSDSAKEAYETMLDNPIDSLPFATSDLFEAQVNVMNVIGHFGEADKKLKEYIARGGKMDTFGADIVGRKKQFNELVAEAEKLADTLKSIGDLGNYTKLQDLLDSSNWVHPEALAEGFYSIIQEYENYNGALISLTDAQRQAIETQLRTHLVEFKNTAGEMVSIAGDTIVGIYRDSEQQIDYLITAAGHAYNTSTQSFTTVTKTMRDNARSAVNGLTLVFDSSGAVSESALRMAQNASSSTISGFNGMKINAGDAVSATAMEIINRGSEVSNAVGNVITNAATSNEANAEAAGRTLAEKIGYSIEDYFVGNPLSLYANIDLGMSNLNLNRYTSATGGGTTLVPHSRSRFGTVVGNSIVSGATAYSTMSTYARTLSGNVCFGSVSGLYSNEGNFSNYRSALQASSYPSYNFESIKPANISFNAKMSDKVDSLTIDKLNALIMKLSNMKDNSGDNVPNFDISIGNKQIDDYIVNVVRRNGYKLSR